jgi:hypothetical protein
VANATPDRDGRYLLPNEDPAPHRCLAVIAVSCASPDRNVYDFASREHARWAQQSREKAAADEATARSLAERGDQSGANDAESAARQAVGDAQTQQLQADKDHWLSQWWPAR